MNRVPIAIIGAGPFGLSLAAHLGALNKKRLAKLEEVLLLA
jgi:cation diffusion facilitator CzcD-associated flavoprotein CzcO